MAWHPIWRSTRKLVDAMDRREEKRGRDGARRASHWALAGLGLFDAVPREQLEALVAPSRLTTLQRRSPIIVDDDAVRVVVAGGVKLTRNSALGRTLIVAILGVGDVFGRISPAADTEPHVVEALEETELLTIDRDAFDELLQRSEFACRVVQLLEDRERELLRRVESLVFKDVRTRLIEALLSLAVDHGEPCAHGMAVDVRITQQDLADLIGASRQMVNRLLAELSRKLYVRRMGKVLCILNKRRLERLVSTD